MFRVPLRHVPPSPHIDRLTSAPFRDRRQKGCRRRVDSPPSLSGYPWLHFAINGGPSFPSGRVEVVASLQVEPESGGRAEVAPQTQRSVDRDRALLAHNVIQTRSRHLEVLGESIDAEVKRFEKVLAEDPSRMNGGKPFPRCNVRKVDLVAFQFFTHDRHVPCSPNDRPQFQRPRHRRHARQIR